MTIPASIGLFAFRVSIVQVIFQHGDFDAHSTAMVARGLEFFAIGLVAFAVVEAVTRAFYAMHDTRTPVIAGVTAVIANIGLSALLAPKLGHGGLALSISLTTFLSHVGARSMLVAANTSTAITFGELRVTSGVTSNSYRRKPPATLDESASRLPFSQTFAR